MPRDTNRQCENFCGLCSRLFVFLIGAGAIAGSFLSSFTCEFYSFRALDGQPWSGLDEPFQNTISANIGIFGYNITESLEPADVMDEGCLVFDNRWNKFDATGLQDDQYWQAAQWCALFAVLFGGIAWCMNLFDCFVCSFYCSFLVPAILLLFASVFQAGTFLLFFSAESSDICFEAESMNECRMEVGAWYSLGSSIAYFLASMALCVSPRPDPVLVLCCSGRGREGKRHLDNDDDDDDDDDSSSSSSSSDSSDDDDDDDDALYVKKNNTEETARDPPPQDAEQPSM